jgi:hypothetical protein
MVLTYPHSQNQRPGKGIASFRIEARGGKLSFSCVPFIQTRLLASVVQNKNFPPFFSAAVSTASLKPNGSYRLYIYVKAAC